MSMSYGGDTINDTDGGVLRPISSVMRNRIINGDMRIDQRNAGAAISSLSGTTYTVDRFFYQTGQSGRFSGQQNQGAVTPPAGFTNYYGLTSLGANTPASGDYGIFSHAIEGLNIADLGWGTASAKTITISFWVRSSVTGTQSIALINSASNRSYAQTYTIVSANTWEQKIITIPGDTSGTWLTTNGVGMFIRLPLSVGSSNLTTPGSWLASNSNGASGTTPISATNGATFYITGVQLEKGTQATGFEYRQYGTELALCQRYYETTRFPAATFNQSATRSSVISAANNNVGGINLNFVVPKRTSPTVTLFSRNNTSGQVSLVSSGADFAGSATANQINSMGFSNILLANNATSGALIEAGYVADAEL